MKLNNFKINPPNFAICDEGKFALRELDDTDFHNYLNEYIQAIRKNRDKQIKLHKEDNEKRS